MVVDESKKYEDATQRVADTLKNAEDKVKRLREELDLLNGTSMNQVQAVDRAASAFERLKEYAEGTGATLEGNDQASRDFRDAIIEVEKANRDAADSMIDNGASIEEVTGYWEGSRTALQNYIGEFTGNPDAAKDWIDKNLGSLDEVKTGFNDLYDSVERLSLIAGSKIAFDFAMTVNGKPPELSHEYGPWKPGMGGLGGTGASGDSTDFDPGWRDRKGGSSWGNAGGFVKDLLGDPEKEASSWMDTFVASLSSKTTLFSGGGGGGGMMPFSKVSFGLNDALLAETEKTGQTWKGFWGKFTAPLRQPLSDLKTSVTDTMTGLKRSAFDPTRQTAETTFRSIADNTFANFKKDTSGAFSWITNSVFGPFQSQAPNIQTAYSNMATGLGSTWESIQDAFRDPTNFVIDQVYNSGIASFWNNLADKVGLGGLKLPTAGLVGDPPKRQYKRAAGGVLPGYTPGRDVHQFTSPTAGNLLLSGGEAIMRPEWTRAVGGVKAVDEMNRNARRGRFATGGVYGGGR